MSLQNPRGKNAGVRTYKNISTPPSAIRFADTTNYNRLSRTFTALGNGKTWTYSCWFKRSNVGGLHALAGYYLSGAQIEGIGFGLYGAGQNNDKFHIWSLQLSNVISLVTTRTFRDPNTWYHAVVVSDIPNPIPNERIRLYINGVRETKFDTETYPPTNGNWSYWNSYTAMYTNFVGCQNVGYSHADGYHAAHCLVDGVALGPESFGYFDANGKWTSKSKEEIVKVVNTGNATSYCLMFDNTTDTTTLGYDSSSKGNHFTLTALPHDSSVTETVTVDNPGNTYATFNPLFVQSTGGPTISKGGLKAVGVASYYRRATSTLPVMESGTYCEFYLESASSLQQGFGLISDDVWATDSNMLGALAKEWVVTNTASGASTATIKNNNVDSLTGQTAIAAGGFGMLAYQNGKLWLGLNGTWYNGGNPATGTGALYTGLTGVKFPVFACSPDANVHFISGGVKINASMSWSEAANGYFRYTPPAGFRALCTNNIQQLTR